MSNLPYLKSCDRCQEQIKMQQVNGKWAAYDVSGTSFHKCSKKNGPVVVENKGPALTLESVNARVIRLEKIMDSFLNAAVFNHDNDYSE